MAYWEVTVGNIGIVYRGQNGFEAHKLYNAYVTVSRAAHGRSSGETVTLMKDGEVSREHSGSEQETEQ